MLSTVTSLTSIRRKAHVVVCGQDTLAHRLVEELSMRDEQVTVLLKSRRTGRGPQIGKISKVLLIESERLDEDAFRAARTDTAKAIAFVHQDDVENVHAALRVRAANPGLPIVLRLFNTALRERVEELIGDCVVLSDAEMAAPSFVATALGEIPDAHVELGSGRTLYLTRNGSVPDATVVCGVASADDGRRLVTAGDPEADLVLAVTERPPRPARPTVPHRLRRAFTASWDVVRETMDRKLRITALVLGAVVIAGTFVIAENHQPALTWLQAAYVVILTTAGGIDPDLKAAGMEQVTHMLVAFSGVALVPVLTASIVETVVGRRLAAASGRLRRPVSDHVVVIGLGNVGVRVVTQLSKLGVPVVAIERDEAAPGVEAARALGVPVVLGDASRPEILDAAYVRSCRSLVAVTSSDVVNLEAAWNARGIRAGLRVVLRVGDGDLARRIDERSDISRTLSVSTVAAPAFAAALTAQDVKGTMTVDRAVLVIAEVVVGERSDLDGAHVGSVRQGTVRTGVWVLAVGEHFGPPPSLVLHPGDRMLVVAGRADLRRTMRRAETPISGT
ncbi:potassium transporter TrkA [Actinorhabdospora filicis]|uniref:Potassium transporter TrkA n=1 Tax=Actinorhabdospora filicis TaxID=1785913 RepID=A0A9W6SJ79_9ACTN|nr:NAD-binding protein [Actinorhabdospora filicis]GLZ76947.1 potassium transporter TrkA [Actinorhabdospora filicis]